jgi:hypothetical protein
MELYLEYCALMAMHQTETLGEIDQWLLEDHAAGEDYERSAAWSYAFERCDEHRWEMELDDLRCTYPTTSEAA